MLNRLFLLALLVPGCALADADLVRKLREGGYVLYLRHAATDFSQNDTRMTSYEDCGNQRNLTEKGRADARAIGRHVSPRAMSGAGRSRLPATSAAQAALRARDRGQPRHFEPR